MESTPFFIAQQRPIRPGMTVSRPLHLGQSTGAAWFSLGGGTSISPERYDRPALYLGAEGEGTLLLGAEHRRVPLGPDTFVFVPACTLCGAETESGIVYTEIVPEKEITMNSIVTPGEPLALKDLISYEEGSIANLDLVSASNMKYVLMAFDAGTGLTPHRAPGNAILTALDGKATIGYEGKDYELTAGQSFRFEKNGLHSVTAHEKFKMSLLLVLE